MYGLVGAWELNSHRYAVKTGLGLWAVHLVLALPIPGSAGKWEFEIWGGVEDESLNSRVGGTH